MDRQYFEEVLGDQLRSMEGRARLKVTLTTGEQFDVWRIFAAHDGYVILEYHETRVEDLPLRSRAWRDENPDLPPWIFPQIALPYPLIASADLTPRTSEADGRPTGFHVES